MKWYEQTYVNHRDWILENLQFLGISAEETVLVLIIDFMNEHHESITMSSLAKHANMSEEDANRIASVLAARKYLSIQVSSASVKFSLNGLFETDIAKPENVLDSSLFDIFEKEFKREFSQKELQKISEWNNTTDRVTIINALREASANQKMSLPYIDAILRNWKEGKAPKTGK